MKTNIKLKVTPEQSEAVQQICFDNNIGWGLEGKYKNIKHLEQSLLFIYDKNITFAYYDTACFVNHENLEIDADLFIRTNGTCEESIDIVDNSSNNKSKEDMFKQYGFEVPDFDCTILAKVKDNYVGYVIDKNGIIAISWTLRGTCYTGVTYASKHNLTPIKQPWYETCKFPVLVWDEDNNAFLLYEVDNFTTDMLDTFRPLSNEEIDQLKQDF